MGIIFAIICAKLLSNFVVTSAKITYFCVTEIPDRMTKPQSNHHLQLEKMTHNFSKVETLRVSLRRGLESCYINSVRSIT